MKFKYAQLQVEYKQVEQRVINLLTQAEMWSVSNGMPEPVVTHVKRTILGNEEIYWKEEQAKHPGMSEADARKLARARFSFHNVLTAVDLRDYIYTTEQYQRLLAWMRSQVQVGMGDGEWEILGHDVGSGHHFHVGLRDMARYHAWMKESKK